MSDEPKHDENIKQSNEDTHSISETLDSEDLILAHLGYKHTFVRYYSLLENFAASFAAVNCVNGVRTLFSYGMMMGGPQAYWATYCIGSPFVIITCCVLAEVCSALPAAGSIYLWAAASGGKNYSRLFGFIVAWWSTCAWTSFIASCSQITTNFVLSEIPVFGLDFDTDVTNVKFRAVQWIVAEGFLLLCMSINYLPPQYYRWVFRISVLVVIVDFVMNVIWLPIGVSQTYGFQSSKFVFTAYENYSGAPDAWNWMLCFFATTGILIGFDASGHVAEETKNASLVAARGIIWSCVSCVLLMAPIILLFLYCCPPLEILFSFEAPQSFVPLYALALGHRAHVVMTVVSTLSTMASQITSVVAASRLIFAIARDGVLPYSSWISRVSPKTHQPKNAITFVGIVASILLCTILPSSLAFQSLVSIAGVPTIAAWSLVSFGQFWFHKENRSHYMDKPKFTLGRLSRPFQLISFVWNTYLVAVLLSPLEFPVTSQNLNYAPVLFAIITIFAIVSYFVISKDKWFDIATRFERNAAAELDLQSA